MKAFLIITAGIIATAIVALAALGALWGLGQTASADPVGSVTLVHVEPGGTEFTGNPYCPQTVWDNGVPIAVDPRHDCNNIVSQKHVIRTEGWNVSFTVDDWSVDSLGANPVIVASGRCGDLAEVVGRSGWDPASDDEQCVIIHSTKPGETSITLSYDEDGFIIMTDRVVKEWDKLEETVILKADNVESVSVPGIGSVELPKDANVNGVRDADDAHLLDHNGKTQDHAMVWDEARKRLKASLGPIQLIEMVHGQHDTSGWAADHPTEGAVILAFIDSPMGCTYFTNPTPVVIGGIPYQAGELDLGTAQVGISDWRGFFIGPKQWPASAQLSAEALAEAAAHLLAPPMSNNSGVPGVALFEANYVGVHVDSVCEEQATITFKVGYPDYVQSLPEIPEVEQVTINWTAVEMAKQPQIRWVGEEIVLEKRWALPDEWYPNTTDTTPQSVCPLYGEQYADQDGDTSPDVVVTHWVMYHKLSGPGALEGAYSDDDGDGYLDSLHAGDGTTADGDIDALCISKALYDSDEPGQVDVEAKLIEQICPVEGGPCTEILINKHAFLVWYLKVYQVKLTNVPGGRQYHNAGEFDVGEGADLYDPAVGDVEAETLNVSQDGLLRVRVKGWFYGGDLSGHGDVLASGRGAVCLDMDGDGDEAGSEPGVPYPLESYETGCTDPDDELLDAGHWVLPDDLPLLASPYPDRVASWDVMSEPDVKATAIIGPKSTLDSHDDTLREVIPCVQPKTVKIGDVWVVVPDWTCTRKTVDPDGKITEADALMPPLKILVELGTDDAGFLKPTAKSADVGIDSAYHSVMIPANPEIPPMVNNGGYDWDSWGWNIVQYDYPFFAVLTKTTQDGLIRDFEFYTDNRGQGFFFVNGDYNLSFEGCGKDPTSGAPDCSPGDVVGKSTLTVIGDYPYFRKHPSVQSNPVTNTWEWGGFKTVTAERIDATHTAIIAHLKDRDGYCKYDVDYPDVTFSPSLNPVQLEEIEFILNTEVGSIIDVSSNGLYSAPPPHEPLTDATVIGAEDGFINAGKDNAIALAEDERVLAGLEAAALVDVGARAHMEDDECQAWVVIEHPMGEDPDVSIVFYDPEGRITRHWPPSGLTVRVRVDQGISIEALGVPAPGLGAFTIDATYDPSALTLAECTADPGGNFDMALCSPDFGPNTIRTTGIRAECGLVGDVPLADLTFDPAPPVCPDDLLVSMETLADCDGSDVSPIVDHKWWVGDADRDFDKDAVDALFILQYVVGLRDGSDQCPSPPGAIHLPSADADCDGDVDAVDALFVLQHVVGLRPVLCPAS